MDNAQNYDHNDNTYSESSIDKAILQHYHAQLTRSEASLTRP